eukprot:1160055-Pelagomonas_calceolata.AAC.5
MSTCQPLIKASKLCGWVEKGGGCLLFPCDVEVQVQRLSSGQKKQQCSEGRWGFQTRAYVIRGLMEHIWLNSGGFTANSLPLTGGNVPTSDLQQYLDDLARGPVTVQLWPGALLRPGACYSPVMMEDMCVRSGMGPVTVQL